jgi:GNAT superfamily N-acetyltransferase
VNGSHSIEIAATPERVWESLVAPGRRDWYYRMIPEGEFSPGGHIRWVGPDAELLEESDVIEANAPLRLLLRTRYLFSPTFADNPAHIVAFEVSAKGGGSQVTLSWDAEDGVARLLESEAVSQLQGLRLAVDPKARAELERLPDIGEVEVKDVTPDLVPQYQHFFDKVAFRDFPAWQFCYCMETHRTHDDAEWDKRTGADNRHDMSRAIELGEVTALLAFADGAPIGWCNYGETTHLAGVVRKLNLDPTAYEGVGSVSCFVIAAPYRGHGVASKLLEAAVERLRSRGVREVEAYPSRTADDTAQGNYRGPLDMYLRAGFKPHRELDRHIVVRKRLA